MLGGVVSTFGHELSWLTDITHERGNRCRAECSTSAPSVSRTMKERNKFLEEVAPKQTSS